MTIGVEPANAARAEPAAASSTKATTKPKAKSAPPAKADPLASEKAAVMNAQSTVSDLSAKLGDSKKVASVDQKAYDKAASELSTAEKKVKAAKAALIDANDKVVAEKTKGDSSAGGLQKVQKLGEKVGTARNTLKGEEEILAQAKKLEGQQRKALTSANSAVSSASSKVSSAQSNVPKVAKSLKVAEKKLAKKTAADQKKAKKESKKQAKRDKAAQKKAMQIDKKQKAKAKAAAKAKAKEVAALKARVKQLKNTGKTSAAEASKNEKELQKLGA